MGWVGYLTNITLPPIQTQQRNFQRIIFPFCERSFVGRVIRLVGRVIGHIFFNRIQPSSPMISTTAQLPASNHHHEKSICLKLRFVLREIRGLCHVGRGMRAQTTGGGRRTGWRAGRCAAVRVLAACEGACVCWSRGGGRFIPASVPDEPSEISKRIGVRGAAAAAPAAAAPARRAGRREGFPAPAASP